MNGVVIVDGTNLLRRAHAIAEKRASEQGYAAPSAPDAADAASFAVVAATVAGTSLIVSRMTHYPETWDRGETWIVFDGGGDSGRTARYPLYKSHRAERSHELSGVADATTALSHAFARLGMKVYADDEHEADDLIAALRARARRDGRPVVIVSTDGDLRQLVGEGTTLRIPQPLDESGTPRNGLAFVAYDLAAFTEEYGFAPSKFVDYKALVGDRSDGVPGVRGIGATWAKRLVGSYGSLDSIYANLDAIKRESVRDALGTQRDEAYLFRELATLQADAPIPRAFVSR